MKFHSQVFDNFFDDPDAIRKTLENEPMNDEMASDGVSYPGIVRLPEIIANEIRKK